MKIESEGRVGFTATLSMEEIERVFLSEVERRAGATREEMIAALDHVADKDAHEPGDCSEEPFIAECLRRVLNGGSK